MLYQINKRNVQRQMLVLLALFALISVLMQCSPHQGMAADVHAQLPIITVYPFDPMSWPVNIPDANLNLALHEACNKPMSEELLRGDLAALTGSLDISERNIANLEGIQYCTKLMILTARGNPLSTLPDMTGMTQLIHLYLDSCRFQAIPGYLAFMPKIEVLSMTRNQIFAANGISGNSSLELLYLSDNQLSGLPADFFLSNIKYLEMSNNQFERIPSALFSSSTLTELVLNQNHLTEIPDELATMASLEYLALRFNQISKIPESLSGSQIKKLALQFNEITKLPASLVRLSTLLYLDVSFNRLTALPEDLSGKTYNQIDVSFNYLDVSTGSTARQIMDSVNSADKRFVDQLVPIKGVRANATTNSIALIWQACPDVNTVYGLIPVKNYDVYLNESGVLTRLAVCSKNHPYYTDSGLEPSLDRQYDLAVIYDFSDLLPGLTSSHMTSLMVRTADPEPTPTPTPSPAPTLSPTPVTTPVTTPVLTTSPTPEPTASAVLTPTTRPTANSQTSSGETTSAITGNTTQAGTSTAADMLGVPEDKEKDPILTGAFIFYTALAIIGMIAAIVLFIIWRKSKQTGTEPSDRSS